MKFKYETWSSKIERLLLWHKWFAWHPVWDNGTCYWLETVERRTVFNPVATCSRTEYRQYEPTKEKL